MRRPRRTLWITLAWLALSACDRGEAPGRAAPTATPESLARGRVLYAAHCSLCHGERGDGQGPRRGSLSRPPASFVSPIWRSRQTPGRIHQVIRDGVRGTDMPGWSRLGEGAVSDLAAYVLSLGAPARDGPAGQDLSTP